MNAKFFCAVFAASVCMNSVAQQIATFETGSTTLGTITGAGSEEQTEFVIDADNPDKTGINTSDKCLYILSNQVYFDDATNEAGRPRWNYNIFSVVFDNPISITNDNQYLHIMHWKEKILNGTWLIYGEAGDSSFVELGRGTCTEAETWFDLMVDVKAKLSSLRGFYVVLDGNWGDDPVARFYAPTKFYYDDIVLNNNSLPRGTETITRQNLLNFEDETVTAATATIATQNASYSTDLHYAQLGSGSNTTEYCAYFSGNTVKPTWWHGFLFTFKSTVDASAYSYLHIMMKKSVEEATNINISLVNTSGTQSSTLVATPLTTEWVDYVMAIPSTHKQFTQMYVKFNAQSANTECFVDEIYLDNSAEARTSISTNNLEAKEDCLISVANNWINVVNKDNDTANVQIYNSAGLLLYTSIGQHVKFHTCPGMYIVRINEDTYKVMVH